MRRWTQEIWLQPERQLIAEIPERGAPCSLFLNRASSGNTHLGHGVPSIPGTCAAPEPWVLASLLGRPGVGAWAVQTFHQWLCTVGAQA